MNQYLMTLTPMEPYFFGNEKTFKYPGQKVGDQSNRYYIKSEFVPAQTTLIGTLRYILLPVKKNFKEYNEDDLALNASVVGERSFQYGCSNKFGKIIEISPLFLLKDDEKLVVTPFDHINGKEKYTPFSSYKKTDDGNHLYPAEFNAKNGVSRSYMSITDTEHKIYEHKSIFTKEIRVGLNRFVKDKGFYKKEYVKLKEGFSFAVYVTLEDDVVPKDAIVFMGQGRSLFNAKFKKVEDVEDSYQNLLKKIGCCLREDVVYCFADAFVKSDIYEKTLFAATDTRDYRAYTTEAGKIRKDSVLYKNICAGSIFIPKDKEFVKLFEDKNVALIGYNSVITRMEEIK